MARLGRFAVRDGCILGLAGTRDVSRHTLERPRHTRSRHSLEKLLQTGGQGCLRRRDDDSLLRKRGRRGHRCGLSIQRAACGLDGRLQIREHGQHSAVRLGVHLEAQLLQDLLYVLLDGPLGDEEAGRNGAVREPLGNEP